MILTLSVSLSVFVGGVALLSQWVDACGGVLSFSLLIPIAALVAIWAACSKLQNSERLPIRVEIEGLLVARGAALALLALPGFGVRPMALSWDGANHLAIIRYLAEHLMHRGLIDTSYINSLGGSISSYPWGWHAFMAGISSITGMDLLQMV